MAAGAGQGKAGAIAGFRTAEQMTDGQAREGEDRQGARTPGFKWYEVSLVRTSGEGPCEMVYQSDPATALAL